MSSKNTKAAATKAKKTAAKPTSKGKNSGKSGGGSKEKSQKAKEESDRYKFAVKACVSAGYINDFETLNSKSFHEKCAHALTCYILDTINNIQNTEVKSGLLEDSYPQKDYLLLEDKTTSTSSRKKTINTGKSNEPPKQKRKPKKKGQTVDEPSADDVNDADSKQQDDAESSGADNETDNNKDKDTEKDAKEEDKKDKTPAKKNVTQINKNGKTWLGFIVNRFTDEIYSTKAGKHIKTDADFVKFILSSVTKDFSSQLTRTIVPTVDRLGNIVNDMKDYDFTKQLTEKIDPLFEDDGRPFMTPYVVKNLVSYFKLMGNILGQQLWVTHKGINGQTVESVMRVLDLGNNAYLVKQGLCQQDENGFYKKYMKKTKLP